jgi:hypothetical protein
LLIPPFSGASCFNFKCFSYLSQLLHTFVHLSLTEFSAASCISLRCFLHILTSFTCVSQLSRLNLTRSFTSHTFNNWFPHLFFAIWHTSFCCFSHISLLHPTSLSDPFPFSSSCFPLSISYFNSLICFSYFKQLILPFLLVILIPLSAAFRTSLVYFSHFSQLLLASLSFISCISFIAFCTFLDWFSRLFSLILAPLSIVSRVFSVVHHIRSYVSHITRCCFSHFFIAYCLLHFLHVLLAHFHMLISVQSATFYSLIYFSFFQCLILLSLLVTSHISLYCFSRLSWLFLISLSVASSSLSFD